VNDSEKKLARGKESLLSGDLDDALTHFHEARDMDEDNAAVHLNLGIAYKLKGDHALARTALEKAKALDGKGPLGNEADRLLRTLITSVVVNPS
jgi:Flp pilus assembly protein TadD